MQTTLAERLKLAMAGPPKVTGRALAAYCGVAAPSVSDWLRGKSKAMEGRNLLAAAEYLKVRPKWLSEGIGPMRGDAPALPSNYNYVPGGYYITECLSIGPGQYFQDDEAAILKLTEGNISLRNDWLVEAMEFHKSNGTMSKPLIAAEAVVQRLPATKPDKMTAELLDLFSQLDPESKSEYLIYLRGFVAGRRPHQVGTAPAMAG